jgi:hypothetical protein
MTRGEPFKAVNIDDFWDLAPYYLIHKHQSFGRTWWWYLQSINTWKYAGSFLSSKLHGVNSRQLSIVVILLLLLLYILEVPYSRVYPKTGLFWFWFSWYWLVPPGKMLGLYLNLGHNRFLQSPFWFIIHSTIRSHTVWAINRPPHPR